MTEINFSDTDRKKLLFFLLNRQEKKLTEVKLNFLETHEIRIRKS